MLLDQYIVCESQGTNEDLGTFLHAILYMVLLKICYRYREIKFHNKAALYQLTSSKSEGRDLPGDCHHELVLHGVAKVPLSTQSQETKYKGG